MEKKKINVGLLTDPSGKAGLTPIKNMTQILCGISEFNFEHLITGGEAYSYFQSTEKLQTYGVNSNKSSKIYVRIYVNYICNQLDISKKILKINKEVDLWIFLKGGDKFIFPMIVSKLIKRKVIIIFTGNSVEATKVTKGPIYSIPLKILQSMNCSLANHLILYSENLIKQGNFERYRHKTSIASRHIVNFEQFKIINKPNKRKDIVGYIGRFSKEKGFENFLKSIPIILNENDTINILIIGSGPEETQEKIRNYLHENKLYDNVKIIDWVPHDKLYEYLNVLKLIVLPSYTEGLPNTILESMACGTIVLATPVGAIPDILIDGYTGFILENNSPESIATNVLRVLNYNSKEDIAKNARELVEKKFSYEKIISEYTSIIKDIMAKENKL